MYSLLYYVAAVIDTNGLPKAEANQASIDTILSIVFSITGSIALLMIAIGGFRYILARGDPSAVSQAKNTILYALIGLIVSLTAFSIVNLVVRGIA